MSELNEIIEGLSRANKAADHLKSFCEHAANCFKAESESIPQAKFGLERLSLDELARQKPSPPPFRLNSKVPKSERPEITLIRHNQKLA